MRCRHVEHRTTVTGPGFEVALVVEPACDPDGCGEVYDVEGEYPSDGALLAAMTDAGFDAEVVEWWGYVLEMTREEEMVASPW